MAVLAPALIRRRSELNSRWPGRDKATDGWIGDPAHAATGSPESGGSGHNPNSRGVVDAYDTDVDGIDCPAVVAADIRHPSTSYVIWNATIWSRRYNFEPRRYTGSNPHTDHVHTEVIQSSAAENNLTPWGIADGVVIPVANPLNPGGTTDPAWVLSLAATLPVLRQAPGVRGSVRKLQALLNLLIAAGLARDGVFGPATDAKVRQFQTARGLAVDGIVGPRTWSELLTLPTLRRGDEGLSVRRAQTLINVSGMWSSSGAELGVDGVFGPATERAVRRYQTEHGLVVDGIVGPATWTALLTR